nr:cytochrome b [Trypanoplasma borreli]
MFRLRFLVFFVLFRNLCCLLLSGDLFRVYGLGFNLGVMIALQILVGICLSWFFFRCIIPQNWIFTLLIHLEFDLGFIIRSLHIIFTSLLYFLLYIHIIKVIFLCLIFDSSMLVWFFGFLIFIFILIIAFIGYTLPCTSMSYWGLTVFSNILATIPLIGIYICQWIWCSEFINDFTLLKLHSIHIFLPFVLLFLIGAHFFVLHYFLSSDGLLDRFPFYYERFFFFLLYYLRDLFLIINILCFLIYYICIYWFFVFHEESWIIVDTLKTSDKILPEWFFLSFFGFLKSVPDKFMVLFLLFVLCFALFLFILNCILIFIYCRSSLLWMSLSLVLFYYLCVGGFLSLYVVLCFPLWMEIQFWVLLLFCFIVCRLD